MTNIKFVMVVFLLPIAAWTCSTESLLESPVCDDESIYHYDTNTCLKIFQNVSVHRYDYSSKCKQYKGGEYYNVSGNLAFCNPDLEIFLRGYMQSVTVTRAAVFVGRCEMAQYDLLRECARNGLDFQFSNVGLMYVTDNLDTSIALEHAHNCYRGPAFCQVQSARTATKESACPSNVTVESVADNNVTLYISPGETKTQVKIRFSVYKPCNNMTSSLCRTIETKRDMKLFLVKPMTYTVVGLDYNTHYTAHFVISGRFWSSYDCNETVEFTTGVQQLEDEEPYDGKVTGISIGLALSLCIIIALAIYIWKLRKMIRDGSASLSPVRLTSTPRKDNGRGKVMDVGYTASPKAKNYNGSQVGSTSAASNVCEINTSQHNRNISECGNYTNVPITSQVYDETNSERDDHIYEM